VTPTATLNPLSIAGLAARAYGGGALQIDKTLQVTQAFTRTLIRYPSDGLRIAGFMNTPAGPGPFPVVIVLHGFIEPENYVLTPYTTSYADALARAGYLVIHPNLRNFPPSDNGSDLFRTGLAIDVLNLIALIDQQAGQPGPLALAQPDTIGLWGHSMGGGVALRVLAISPDVDAAVLASAVSGDDKANFDYLFRATKGAKGKEERSTPDEVVAQIAPIHHLDRVHAPVSIHHGRQDPGIPVITSEDLCQRLRILEKPVDCFFYPNEAHIFGPAGTELLMQRSREFFDRHLKP
jgi:dienelactone hydrolase